MMENKSARLPERLGVRSGIAGPEGGGSGRASGGALAGGGRTYHPLDLVGGVGLAADRQQRRGGAEIDRIDNALDLGGDRHVVAGAVLAGGGQGVSAGRPLDAIVTLAIPDETGTALFQVIGPGIGGLARRIRDRDRRAGVLVGMKIPGR